MVKKYIFVAALVMAFGGAAICGSGKKSAAPASDTEYLWLATAAANDANLTIDDFPAAWESEPQDPDDEEDEDDEDFPEWLSEECREFFESFDDSASDAANADNPTAESDDFSDPDTRESVSTEVEVYRTVEFASEGEDRADEVFDTCGDELGRAIEEQVNEDAAAEGGEFKIENLEMLDFAKRDLGDFARDWGFSLTYDFGGLKVDATLKFTFIRVGRMSGTFFHFQLDDETDAALIDSMREVFADRLGKVNDTLPE
jgi:hypothetical protein